MPRLTPPARAASALLALLAGCAGARQYETVVLVPPGQEAAPAPVPEPRRVSTPPEAADDWTPIRNTAQLRAGAAFIGKFKTVLSPDSERFGAGTTVDLEDDLGLSGDAFAARIDAFYRFDRRHRVDFSYYDIRRSGQRTLDREVQWGVFGEPQYGWILRGSAAHRNLVGGDTRSTLYCLFRDGAVAQCCEDSQSNVVWGYVAAP